MGCEEGLRGGNDGRLSCKISRASRDSMSVRSGREPRWRGLVGRWPCCLIEEGEQVEDIISVNCGVLVRLIW